ncbi:MAG: serine protease [Aquisalinus sp.]|nr:serine protease [Aquisalinus sp.]
MSLGSTASAETCSEFEKGYWDSDYKNNQVSRVRLSGKTFRVQNFDRAAGQPESSGSETTHLFEPAVATGTNTANASSYRAVVAMISDRSQSGFAKERLDESSNNILKSFRNASGEWTMSFSTALAEDMPFVLTQSTPRVSNGAIGYEERDFVLGAHALYLTPVAAGGTNRNNLITAVRDRNAPLPVMAFIMSLTEFGQPLGFYDPSCQEGEPCDVACYLNSREIESKLEGEAPDLNYLVSVKQSAQARADRNTPHIQPAVYPEEAELQTRVDKMTDSVVWLNIEYYSWSESQTQSCTGFMISPRHIMTAEHCFEIGTKECKTLSKWSACYVRGWLRRKGGDNRVKAPEYQFLDLLFTGASAQLDYAVLEIPDYWLAAGEQNYNPRNVFPLMAEGNQPVGLTIPQFPNSRAFVFSTDEYCATATKVEGGEIRDISGIADPAADTFVHFCDTLGGSSGSPVFNPDLSGIIGVHKGVVNRDDFQFGNRATKMSLILEHMNLVKLNARTLGFSDPERIETAINEIESAQRQLRESSGEKTAVAGATIQ